MDPEFDWDVDKAASNLAKHGVSFEVVPNLPWSEMDVRRDGRFDYGKERWRALDVSNRLLIVFTRRGGRYRIISVRRVHAKEVRQWERRS
ncbi:MAG: BrnT family toxin [Hyphomicrobiales bacterium]|nr:MAG: BrnT family toxin [Hyphomicrobiales bacterium]